jgi:hypothetical protein
VNLDKTIKLGLIRWRFVTLIWLLFAFPAITQADFPDSGFWSFQIENDLFGSSDDRYYTSGFQVSFATTETPPAYLQAVSEALPFYKQGEVNIYGLTLGQNMFTPEDTDRSGLVVDDRPYAGWLYLETGIAHADEMQSGQQVINGFLITLGVVGPASLAEQTQNSFHDLINADKPRGWDHQIENELGLNVRYVRKKRYLIEQNTGRQFELSRHSGIVLGNVYTYIAAGAMLRWGSQLENDIGPPSIAPGFTGMPPFRPNPTINWYLYAGFEGRLMGRNIFLDGNTFRDSHSVNKEALVGDLQFGFAFHVRNVRVAFSHTIRSKEFEGQTESARYGAINLTFYTG